MREQGLTTSFLVPHLPTSHPSIIPYPPTVPSRDILTKLSNPWIRVDTRYPHEMEAYLHEVNTFLVTQSSRLIKHCYITQIISATKTHTHDEGAIWTSALSTPIPVRKIDQVFETLFTVPKVDTTARIGDTVLVAMPRI
ncbi:Hypothetical predicted protein [Pelobates cultripes]|uniref:Uncharacterized protein n=1 Tax=Pelobates cultripes TaxID=61616 RepID=A0AAD1SXU9_PELCU|nr:Hypothetical predicted protein [Pelobates cultripes]